MPVPDFTPYEGLLPSETDPATFPARAEALMSWFTQTGAPQLAALASFLDGIMNDESTVLDALDSLEASLGTAAQQPFTNNNDLAVNPSHVGSRGNVAAYIGARDFTSPHLSITSDAVGNTTFSPGADQEVPFDLELSKDAGVLPGVSLSSGDIVGLPSGTYYAEWAVTFLRSSGSNTGYYLTTLRDKTAGADLGHGLAGACSGYDRGVSTGSVRFTLAAGSTTLGILADTLTNNLDLVAKNASFSRPAYSRHLRLWKVA